MSGSRRSVAFLGACLLVVLVGCSSGGTGGGGGGSTAPGGGGASSAPAGGGGGGGNVGGIDACALLTTDEIKSALNVEMSPGVKKGGDSPDCTWDAVDASKGLSVEVQVSKFDQDLWNGETNLDNETKVDGVGDEAVRGFVSQGVLLIHKGGAEIDLTIVAIFTDQQPVSDAQVTLGKLIVSRL